MRWDDFRRSDNVEDDRGAGGGFGGSGGSGIQFGGGGLGIGTVIVLGLIGWATGIDPRILIGGAELIGGGSHYQQPYRPANRRTGTPTDAMGQFVAAVLGNTEDTWGEIFRASGQQYRAPRLRLFSGSEQGGCGSAQAAMGPFYCPTDRRIYLDMSFFREIETRFHGCQGNACKFSQAYVIAHEVGHHVQNLLGTLPKAQAAQRPPATRPPPTAFRCESNCRRIATPAYGQTIPSNANNSSIPATSMRRCRPPVRSATTRCRSVRRGASCRTRLPTARRSSASAGSPPVSRKASCRPAIRSRRHSSKDM